jgi:hypothetical protein
MRVTLGRNFWCCNWKGCIWSMQCNVEFGYQLGICSGTKETLDRVGRLQDLPDANWLVTSSPALHTRALILVLTCAVALLKNIYKLFYRYFYVHIFWISTKQCITPAKGMNAYMHKYTYICICDSLIIGKFGSLLWFGKIGCYTRFVAHPVTKIMVHSSINLIFSPYFQA